MIKFSDILLVEDFKSQKANFISQGGDEKIIDHYLKWFRIIKDRKPKQLFDDVPNLSVPKEKRIDIDSYKSLEELISVVRYIFGQVDFDDNEDIEIENSKVLVDNNDMTIMLALSARACVKYKEGGNYSWCVSAKNMKSNLYGNYRYGSSTPTFYFVKFKDRTEREKSVNPSMSPPFKDNYHFFVIQVPNNVDMTDVDKNQYTVTTSNNNHTVTIAWNRMREIDPRLEDLQHIFVSHPLSSEDTNTDDQPYCDLSFKSKKRYIDKNKEMSFWDFKCTPDELKKYYIETNRLLDFAKYSFILNDTKLTERYAYLVNRSFQSHKKQIISSLLKNSTAEKDFHYILSILNDENINVVTDNLLNFDEYSTTEYYYGVQNIKPYIKNNDRLVKLNEILKQGLETKKNEDESRRREILYRTNMNTLFNDIENDGNLLLDPFIRSRIEKFILNTPVDYKTPDLLKNNTVYKIYYDEQFKKFSTKKISDNIVKLYKKHKIPVNYVKYYIDTFDKSQISQILNSIDDDPQYWSYDKKNNIKLSVQNWYYRYQKQQRELKESYVSKIITRVLSEEIRASEARTDFDSIMSVAEGNRGVAFITIFPNSEKSRHLEELVHKYGLKMVRCPSKPINVVIFSPSFRKDAMELVSIAEKYNGYLSVNATEEDSRRIGQLLSYHEDDINDYINRTGEYKR